MLTLSLAFTFTLTAQAEIKSYFYNFANGNKVEFRINSKDPSDGNVLLYSHGEDQPRYLRQHVRIAEINIHQFQPRGISGALRSVGKILDSPRWLKRREVNPSRKDGNTWFKTKGGDTIVIDENGATGRIPFSYSQIATATVTHGDEKFLVASLNNTEAGGHLPSTYVIGSRNDKIVKVANMRVLLDKGPPSVEKDILTIPEISEKVNLTYLYVVAPPEIASPPEVTPPRAVAPPPEVTAPRTVSLAKDPAHDPAAGAHPVAVAAVVEKEEPLVIPFKKWEKIAQHEVTHGNEKYLVISLNGEPAVQGSYVIRLRDNKIVKVARSLFYSYSSSGIDVKDGILSIPGIERKIDLDAFSGEAKFQASLIKDVVLNKEGATVDSTKEVLKTYRDLVSEAKNAPQDYFEKTDPEVTAQLAEALRAKRSAVALGQAGTGKTSSIRALARAIAEGKVPGVPRTLKILEVPMSNLASGTKHIGVIEERISMLKAAAQEGGIVYFIDEVHSMSGVGTHSEKSTDITQDLKGMMEKGEFLILGTSTDHEFQNAFAKDPAFSDRFDRISVKQPQGEELIEIVSARMAKEYSVKPDRAAIEEAIHLSNELDVVTAQPRAAVNLLKKAYAILEGKGIEDTAPDSAVLKEAAIKRYGVDPAHFSREARRQRLAKLVDGLDKRAVGQANAKATIHSTWKRVLTGVGDPETVNTALFYGPPGVGKTMLAKASAQEMGYDYTVIEMNKFAQGGVEEFRREIYRELQKNPFRVFILDELEKSPIAVQDAALSILQDGHFMVTERLSGGGEVLRSVKAKHAVFFLTTNAAGNTQGKLEGDALKAALHRGNVSEPLLSRMGTIQYLDNPTEEEFKSALKRSVQQTLERESAKQKAKFVLSNESEFIEALSKSYTPQSDYRDVGKLIRTRLEEAISDAVLHDDFQEHGKVELHWNPMQEKLAFKCFMDQLEKMTH